MQNLLYILLGVCLVLSCRPSSTFDQAEKTSVELEVRDMFQRYHEAISKDGLTAEFAYLDSSSDFYWVPPGYHTPLSYDSVHSILMANAPSFTQVDFHWESLKLFPLSKNIVNFSGVVGGTMLDTAGNNVEVSLIESGTCIRRPDGWKLLSGQTANIVE